MRSSTTFAPGSRRRGRAARATGLWVVLVLAAFSVASSALAAPPMGVVVAPGSGRDVSASFVDQARSLLVLTLWQSKRVTVVDVPGPASALPPTSESLASLARGTSVPVAIAFDLGRSGPQSPVSFTITCVDATGLARCDVHDTYWTMPTDLPLVMQSLGARLIEALQGSPTSAASSQVAARPSRTSRVGAKSNFFVPLPTAGLDRENLGGFGVSLSYDARSYVIDVSAEYAAGFASSHLGGVGASVLAPLGAGPPVPYAGAGLFAISQNLGGQGAMGLQARPTLGLMVGRDALVRLRFEVSYVVDLFTEKGADRLFPGSDRSFRMHGFLFTMGAAL